MSSFLCSSAYKCICVHVWLCICSVHVSVHLSRSQKVWWATQVGFSEVIIFAWLTIGCHALAPNSPSNTDIKLPTHTQTHLCTFPILSLSYTHTHPLPLSSFLLSGLKEQTAEHTHTWFLLQLDCSIKWKEKEWGNWRVFKWPGGLETPRSSHYTPLLFLKTVWEA